MPLKEKYQFIIIAVILSVISSTALAQSKKSSVTVYNGNIALIKEVRNVSLQKGISTVSITGVASKIDPTSVSFSPKGDPNEIQLLEQNYEYDLVGARKLFQKYIDKNIEVSLKSGKSFKGILLSSTGSDIIIRLPKGTVRMYPVSAINGVEFPKLPDGLITKPTLVWKLDSDVSGNRDVEVNYLTGGIDWHAEYILTLGKDNDPLDLSSWVSVDNRSGATYTDATLKVVAGDIGRIRARPKGLRKGGAAILEMQADAGFEERGFFEYHIYELGRLTTLKDNEIKQISLFEPAKVNYKKIYEYNSSLNKKNVKVKIEFDNNENSGLGIPLPAGKVRIYNIDTDGAKEFAGEDLIGHTPIDEKVSVTVGSVFDVIPEWRQIERKKIGERKWRIVIEVKIKNHKEEEISVEVIERLQGSWKIKNANFDYETLDANHLKFILTIPSKSEKILRYSYESEY